MKPSVIVYTSNTGFTAQYASLLGAKPDCLSILWKMP